MRHRIVMAAGALMLAPLIALGDQAPMVRVNGQIVPVQQETQVVQTAAGPARVSSWSWHSPSGNADIQVQTSTGGAPPEWVIRQMQTMQVQMHAAQLQMEQLQRAAMNGLLVMPAPTTVMFVMPAWPMIPALMPMMINPPVHRRAPPLSGASAATSTGTSSDTLMGASAGIRL